MIPIEEITLSSLNKIYDNLWIGDYSAIKKIGDVLHENPEYTKFLTFGDKGVEITKDLRKQFKKKPEEEFFSEFKKRFLQESFSYDNFLIGLICQRIEQKYNYSLGILEKSKTEDIEQIQKSKTEDIEIIQKSNFKFKIINKYPKYETRAIFNTRTKFLTSSDLEELKVKMSSKISIQTTKSSSVLKFFSQNLFLEAVIMPYTGWIETMLPDSKIQDVTQFSEIVLEKFVENEKTKITV